MKGTINIVEFGKDATGADTNDKAKVEVTAKKNGKSKMEVTNLDHGTKEEVERVHRSMDLKQGMDRKT